ncbi:hypothetical protein IQ07DRAFT_508260, partial [Pyrenochaeta sp. DS3sAY3a]
VILITGAANGVGEAASKLFAAEGANLEIPDLEAPKLEGLKSDLSKYQIDVQCLICDFSLESDVSEAVAKVIECFG